jgi:hypothetical protein
MYPGRNRIRAYTHSLNRLTYLSMWDLLSFSQLSVRYRLCLFSFETLRLSIICSYYFSFVSRANSVIDRSFRSEVTCAFSFVFVLYSVLFFVCVFVFSLFFSLLLYRAEVPVMILDYR